MLVLTRHAQGDFNWLRGDIRASTLRTRGAQPDFKRVSPLHWNATGGPLTPRSFNAVPAHHERPLVHLGIDLGGTSLRVGAFDSEFHPLSSHVVPTRVRSGPEAGVRDMAQAVAALLDEAMGLAYAIGLGSPGPLNLVEGTLGQLPNFPGWDFFPLRSALEEMTGLRVVLDCDANAAALAEWKLGAGSAQSVDSMVM